MEMVPQRLFCCIVHISASDIDTLLKLVTMQLYQKKNMFKESWFKRNTNKTHVPTTAYM